MYRLPRILKTTVIGLVIIVQTLLPAAAWAQDPDSSVLDPADSTAQSTEPTTEDQNSTNTEPTAKDSETFSQPPTDENTEPLSLSPDPPAPSQSSTIENTGDNSNNTIENNNNNQTTIDTTHDAVIINQIEQNATSGNATLANNDDVGNATTGDAQSSANVVNMIQSSWGVLGSDGAAVYVADINGDVVGDLYIDPSQFPDQNSGNVDITISQTALIQNDIDVSATSGNATITGNDDAGNATSGNAVAIVNLINMINSAIYANKSFVGILNINGNLDGDILVPPAILNSLIANTGSNSNNTITNTGSNSLTVEVSGSQSISNNIVAQATSGNALIAGNDNAGHATTGSATTQITLLNLTNQTVVAKNAIVVFVNVMGRWVGMIMNAPPGATSSILTTGDGSNNTITTNNNSDTNVNITENSRIENNIRAVATTGDATLTNNDDVGNATTGDALASVNVLNVIGSKFVLSDWFGVLFINVFGSWNGSFGVDTAAGNQPPGGQGGGPATAVSTATTGTPPQVFGFAARRTAGSNSFAGDSSGPANPAAAAVATINHQTANDEFGSVAVESTPTSSRSWFSWIIYIAVVMTALTYGIRGWLLRR